MRQQGMPYLREKAESGITELHQREPIMSVTINPTGWCAKEIEKRSLQLAELIGTAGPIHPHVTLQAVYNEVSSVMVEKPLAALSAKTAPFSLTLRGVGFLRSSSDPARLHLLLNVEKTVSLLRLFRQVRKCLLNIGAKTYPYTVIDWQPHLTLVYGHFPEDLLREQAEELDRDFSGCSFEARALVLNQRRPDGKWIALRTFPLLGTGHPERALEEDLSECPIAPQELSDFVEG